MELTIYCTKCGGVISSSDSLLSATKWCVCDRDISIDFPKGQNHFIYKMEPSQLMIAAMAMQGMLSNPEYNFDIQKLKRIAFFIADEMLKIQSK